MTQFAKSQHDSVFLFYCAPIYAENFVVCEFSFIAWVAIVHEIVHSYNISICNSMGSSEIWD